MSEAVYFPDTDVSTLVEHLRQLPRPEEAILLLLVAEQSTIDIQELWTALNQGGIPFAGGIFPGVIYGDKKYESGIVADVLPVIAEPSIITGLDSNNFQMDHLPELANDLLYTALVVVDGLTDHIGLFLDRLFRRVGNHVHYIGGGAGSLSFQKQPCLFDQHGIYQDAALVIWLKTEASLGVRHGWLRVRGPFIATKTSGPIVYELDGRPALDVYKRIVEMKTGKTLTTDNFFTIAKEYPLGIFHPRTDYIVRDPIAANEDLGLVCVGEVPERSLVYILVGNKNNLINSAHQAAAEAMINAFAGHHTLIVDCISRVLYLEDQFEQELNAVLRSLPDHASRPFGMLSLGEIATFATGRVEFFNKTLVVGALQEIP